MKQPGFALFLFVALAAPVLAQEPAKSPSPALPWAGDMATFQAAQPDLHAGGINALASHVADFEAALVHGKPFFPDGATIDGHRYVMVDGLTETLMVTLAATAKKSDGVTTVSAVLNPYPLIGFELGSYYNEIGKPEDAIRVIDEALSLSPSPDGAVGAHVGELMNEKGVALGSLKRNSEALDIFEQALASHVLTVHERALLDRGRGYTLTELNRLDEAEAAYRDSLKYEPGNKRAETELGYIAHLRAGGSQAPRELFSSPPQKPQ